MQQVEIDPLDAHALEAALAGGDGAGARGIVRIDLAHDVGPRRPAGDRLADEAGCTPAQLALAWLLAQPGVVTIPKSSSRERVKENFAALDVELSPKMLAELDRAFPPPKGKQPLEML